MFVFGRQYSGIFSEIHENDYHKNIACLVILGDADDIAVIDKSGARYTGSSVVVKSMVEHTLLESSRPVWCLFLAPHSSLAASLDEFTGDSGISSLPPDAVPFHRAMSKSEVSVILEKALTKPNNNIDPRLARVLNDLDKAPLNSSIMDIAKRCELSPSRLRALAKEQIGISLATMFLWRKLVKSMEVLSLGSTFSEAAQAGGFSDQAHFTRTVRKMFGTTPTNSLQAMSYQN